MLCHSHTWYLENQNGMKCFYDLLGANHVECDLCDHFHVLEHRSQSRQSVMFPAARDLKDALSHSAADCLLYDALALLHLLLVNAKFLWVVSANARLSQEAWLWERRNHKIASSLYCMGKVFRSIFRKNYSLPFDPSSSFYLFLKYFLITL